MMLGRFVRKVREETQICIVLYGDFYKKRFLCKYNKKFNKLLQLSDKKYFFCILLIYLNFLLISALFLNVKKIVKKI